jgi:RNA polymerase sigma factor (sigma-70 family)
MGSNESDDTTESDWDLVRRAKGGDEPAYAALVHRHQAALHAFVFRSVRSYEESRDLTQEVFVRAWFALQRVREDARFTTWLFQIAVNLCRDHAKSKATRNARQTDSLSRPPSAERHDDRDFPSADLTPDANVVRSETIAALEAEVRALPPELQPAFVLGALEGRSHREVAEILKLSAKAVEVRIYRARRWLVERLARRGIGGASPSDTFE